MTTATKQNVAEMLRACRERSGMTQQQLAAKLHVDRSTIAKVENGIIKEPSYTLVREWCAATNGMDLMSIDFSGGNDGWKKLRQLEQLMRQMRAGMESINFLRRKEQANAKQRTGAACVGGLRGRIRS